MKKTGLILAALLTAAFPCTVSAETAPTVTVTIANAGTIEVAAEQIALTDADADGALTINDALLLAHDQFYDGGADAGYKAVTSDWGLSMETLWGVTNGGSYGYMVNDGFVMSLADPLSDGDALYAYVYTDAASFSDEYTFFDIRSAEGLTQGDTLKLKLSGNAYDENWEIVAEPIADAVITVNGEKTAYKTDAEGNVTVTVGQAGDVVISAVSEDKVIIPPIFRASVAASAETTAETSGTTTTATTTASATSARSTTAAQTAAAAKTGDTDALPALTVTALLAAAAGYALRRRADR